MKLQIILTRLDKGTDSYQADFPEFPRRIQTFDMKHNKKIIRFICTDISTNRIIAEQIEIDHDDVDLEVTSISAL